MDDILLEKDLENPPQHIKSSLPIKHFYTLIIFIKIQYTYIKVYTS